MKPAKKLFPTGRIGITVLLLALMIAARLEVATALSAPRSWDVFLKHIHLLTIAAASLLLLGGLAALSVMLWFPGAAGRLSVRTGKLPWFKWTALAACLIFVIWFMLFSPWQVVCTGLWTRLLFLLAITGLVALSSGRGDISLGWREAVLAVAWLLYVGMVQEARQMTPFSIIYRGLTVIGALLVAGVAFLLYHADRIQSARDRLAAWRDRSGWLRWLQGILLAAAPVILFYLEGRTNYAAYPFTHLIIFLLALLGLAFLAAPRDKRLASPGSWITALRRVNVIRKAIDGCSSALRYVSRSTHWSGYLLRAATFTLPFLAYAAVLASKIPIKIGWEARTGTGTAFLLLFAVLLYPIFRHSGWWEDLGSLAVTLVFFALPLSGLWNSGFSNGYVIGGLLPFADGVYYYMDANRLLAGQMMSAFSEARPLFPGTLAVVLGLVHGNLAVALAIFGAVAILACFLLAREVRHSHGTTAGLVTLVVLFLFFRAHIGITFTENLGFALGAIALAVLWRGAGSSKKGMVWAGIFLLTVALNARAGAFLILPLLALWGGWLFRGNSRISLRFFFSGCTAILLGFLLDAILRHLVSNSGGMAYGNFSYVLYGLVMGGKGWGQVLIDHPEIHLAMRGSQQYSLIYSLAFDAFRADPMRAARGFLSSWWYYLTPNPGAFGFVNINFLGILNTPQTQEALFAATSIGLLGCIRQARAPRASLVLMSSVGILASVPFVIPGAFSMMRAYAATIPFVALWVVLGLHAIFKGLKWPGEPHAPTDDRPALSPVILGLVIVLFCFLSPVLVKGLSHPTQFSGAECPSSLESIIFRTDRSVAVNLISDDTSSSSHLPDIRLSDFRNQMNFGSYPEVADIFIKLTAGQTLILAPNMSDSGYGVVWLIADTSSLSSLTGVVMACSHPVESVYEWTQREIYHFYWVDTIERIQEIGK